MPRIIRTIVPRIRRSIRERGFLVSFSRAFLLPIHLFREHEATKRLVQGQWRSDFDLAHNVDTDGDFDDWTYLSDLRIDSPNWICGNNYSGIEPERFYAILSALNIRFEDFVFIDFGSGKGRALLLASEFPFKRVVGVEFSPELHETAQRNIQTYRTTRQQCGSIDSVFMDFVHYPLPHEPSVLFFFDPCADGVFLQLLENIKLSLCERPRQIYIIYVAPSTKESLLDSAGFLLKVARNEERNFSLYKCRSGLNS